MCGSCGRDVPPGATRCARCGYELQSVRLGEAPPPAAPTTPVPNAGMYGSPGSQHGMPVGGYGPPPAGYGGPYGAPSANQWSGVDPVSAVRAPAIALIVTGILSVLVCLATIVFGIAEDGGQDPEGTVFAVVFLAIGAILSGVMIAGANAMRRLQSYSLAMAAMITSLCLGLCCTPAIAFGIWGIVVLSKPEVKAAFDQNRR